MSREPCGDPGSDANEPVRATEEVAARSLIVGQGLGGHRRGEHLRVLLRRQGRLERGEGALPVAVSLLVLERGLQHRTVPFG